MQLCSDGHKEVCYDGRKCPVCKLMSKKQLLESELIKVLTTNDDLKDELRHMQERVEELEERNEK